LFNSTFVIRNSTFISHINPVWCYHPGDLPTWKSGVFRHGCREKNNDFAASTGGDAVYSATIDQHTPYSPKASPAR
jgi:hypothetical protein